MPNYEWNHITQTWTEIAENLPTTANTATTIVDAGNYTAIPVQWRTELPGYENMPEAYEREYQRILELMRQQGTPIFEIKNLNRIRKPIKRNLPDWF